MDENLPAPLDPVQLHRIESVHRGFLYQHLYAVGCLLLAGLNSSTLIRVERDEDVEVCFSEAVVYIQVKTRETKLYSDDISDALARFDEIRRLHERGERAGNAFFIVISNVPIGGSLADGYAQKEWPSDVVILFPGASKKVVYELPPAWKSLTTALSWCVKKAEALPFCLLNPQTLVWKLAAVVQWACTGKSSQSHIFKTDLLHELFEQVVGQLQSFPPEPPSYREHMDEPAYVSSATARLIVGHSGSGKSVWASRLAFHSPDPVVYFDAALSEEVAVTSSLARELAARLILETGGRPGGLFLPGASGFETLAALNSYATKRAFSPIVVIDNAHRIFPEVLVRTKEVAAAFRWIFICQPSPNQVELAALLSLTPEHIQPWSLSSVAAEFEDKGCHLTPKNAQHVTDLTGGIPLFVRSVATLCKKDYAGDIGQALQDIEWDLTLTTTAQEVIANRVYSSLPAQVREAASIMSLSPLPHSKEDLLKLLSGLIGDPGRESVSIRDLLSSGIAQVKAEGDIGLHDAFRIFCSRDIAAMPPERVEEALRRLRDIYHPPWAPSDFKKIGPYFKALAGLGDYKTIIDICGSKGEFLYELGLSPVVNKLLYQAIGQTFDAEDLFYILDTLCFWSIQDGDEVEARRLLDEMAKILESGKLSPREQATFYLKRMSLYGQETLEKACESYQAALGFSGDSLLILILRYNYATLLLKYKQYKQAAEESFGIAMEYFERLGLDSEDVFAKNPPEIFANLKGKEYDIDDFKRLADSLDLYGRCCVALRQPYGIARIHAFKFYTMAYAIRSAIKVGMDVVDDFIGLMGDVKGARDFIESTLLPTLNDFKVLDYFLPIRAQYAVVLSYCGDFVAARKELAKLAPFLESAAPEWVKEVESQAALINEIEEGKVRLVTAHVRAVTTSSQRPARGETHRQE